MITILREIGKTHRLTSMVHRGTCRIVHKQSTRGHSMNEHAPLTESRDNEPHGTQIHRQTNRHSENSRD